MEGSYSRRRIQANAAYSQLRIAHGNAYQEVTSDGQSASEAYAFGRKATANTDGPGPVSNTNAGAPGTGRYHALRAYFRIRAGQTRTHAHDSPCLRARSQRSPRRYRRR